jgi:hypothetical protein
MKKGAVAFMGFEAVAWKKKSHPSHDFVAVFFGNNRGKSD